jgi:hypothetical protein
VMSVAQPSVAVVGPHNKLETYDRFAGRFGAAVSRQAAE